MPFKMERSFSALRLSFLLDDGALFCNASLLTGEITQVVQLGTTYLTYLVHYNAVNVGAFQGENTLNTNGTRHLAHGKALLVSVT